MSTTLMFTMGTRDVQVPQAFVNHFGSIVQQDRSKRIKGYMQFTEIRDTFELIEEGLRKGDLQLDWLYFPMAQGTAQYLKRNGQSPDTITLISSDQQTTAAPAQRGMDTLQMAQVVERYFREVFPEAQYQHLAVDCKLYDAQAAYEYLSVQFADPSSPLHPSPETHYFISNQGGIHAFNYSLMLLALENYPQTTFLSKPEIQEKALEQSFPKTFRKRLRWQSIKPLLESYQFQAVAEVLPAHSLSARLARYAHFRLDLNTGKALQEWIQIEAAYSEHPLLRQSREQLQLKNEPQELLKARLNDAFLSAMAAYHNEQVYDLLGRLFTLREIFLKKELYPFLGDTSALYQKNQSGVNLRWEKALHETPGLVAFLEKEQRNSNFLSNPSTYLESRCFHFLMRDGHLPKIDAVGWQRVDHILNRLKPLRNQAVHQGRGLTLVALEKEIRRHGSGKEATFKSSRPGNELFQELNKLLQLPRSSYLDSISHLITTEEKN